MISSSRTIDGVAYTGNYTFNGLSQRVAKNVSGQVRYFVYNENNQVVGEYDSAGNVINEYVYFGLRPVAVKNNGSLNIVHTDYLGTPRVVTSGLNGGSMIWQWKNDNPYGYNEANGSIEFNLRFAGQYYDSESGLHYNMFRTYNPEIGRYMQSDPIGLAGGFNTYNYVGRNPLDGIDPLGLNKEIFLDIIDSNRPAAYVSKNWSNALRVVTHATATGEGWYHYMGTSVNSRKFGQVLADTEYLQNRLKNNIPALIILDACETAKSDSINRIYNSILEKNANYTKIPIYIVGATHEVRGFLWNYETQWSFVPTDSKGYLTAVSNMINIYSGNLNNQNLKIPLEFGEWKVFLNGVYMPSRNLANPNRSDFNPTGGIINVR